MQLSYNSQSLEVELSARLVLTFKLFCQINCSFQLNNLRKAGEAQKYLISAPIRRVKHVMDDMFVKLKDTNI